MSIRSMLIAVAAVVPSIVAPITAHAGAQPSPWVEPVAAPVVDGYRPPAHVGAPGNRGWEYATEPGTVVVSAGTGVVVFAGPIGASNYISVQHPDGRRTTYSHVATIGVEVGQTVVAGTPLGTTGTRLHFGVRMGSDYQDPAQLFVGTAASGADVAAEGGGDLRLVPAGERPASIQPRSSPPATRSSAPPGTWFGHWLAERQPVVGATSVGWIARGWSGAVTDTLAGGPQHTAAAP